MCWRCGVKCCKECRESWLHLSLGPMGDTIVDDVQKTNVYNVEIWFQLRMPICVITCIFVVKSATINLMEKLVEVVFMTIFRHIGYVSLIGGLIIISRCVNIAHANKSMSTEE